MYISDHADQRLPAATPGPVVTPPMSNDRWLAWCARSYAHLLRLLPGRDTHERAAIQDDGARLLAAAHGRGRGALVRTWAALLVDVLFVGARHDVAQALRSVVRSPAVTVGLSLLLAFGVAATATLFAFVDAVLVRPLPYDAPEQLVVLFESNASQNRLRAGAAPGNVLDWAARNDAFEAITAMMRVSATLRAQDGGTPVAGVHVTYGFFDVFRQRPLIGRTFLPAEYEEAASITSRQTSGEPVVVLSHRLWQTLGADPGIVDRTLHIEGRDWRVIGVMPREFAAPDADAAFWAPWDMRVSYRGARFPNGPPREARFLYVVGRMKPGLSPEGASARLDTLARGLAAAYPASNAGWTIQVAPLGDEIARTSRLELLLVFGAMACLLALLCANVASIALARGMARGREMSIRLALGAARSRLRRQLLAESLLCALLTAGFAVVLTAWWVGAALSIAPADVPRLHEVAVNARVVWFAVVLALVATLLGHAAPTWRAGRTPIAVALKDGVALSGREAGRLRTAMVVVEMAVAVMLLVGAGLLVRTFASLQQVDVGFDTANLLVMRTTPDAARYRTNAQTTDYYRRVLDALRAMPAVQSAAAVTSLPMSALGAEFTRPFWPEHAQPQGSDTPEASIRMATPDYFRTLARPVIAGREFTARDDAEAPRVVIVNETLARRAWGSQSPIGRSLMLDYQRGVYPYEVVGVVRDSRHHGPRSEPSPEIFIPHAQNPYLVMNVVARTSVDAATVAQAARAAALAVDPDQPVHSLTTMDALMNESVQLDRFAMLLVSLFSAGGLITAVAGIYGLVAYSVAQRRREIALRMALGASPRRVARSVVREALVLALTGALIGLVAAAVASRFVQSLLFGVAPQDPVTGLAAVVVLVLAVLAASWIPARRASLIEPVRAMRIQ